MIASVKLPPANTLIILSAVSGAFRQSRFIAIAPKRPGAAAGLPVDQAGRPDDKPRYFSTGSQKVPSRPSDNARFDVA